MTPETVFAVILGIVTAIMFDVTRRYTNNTWIIFNWLATWDDLPRTALTTVYWLFAATIVLSGLIVSATALPEVYLHMIDEISSNNVERYALFSLVYFSFGILSWAITLQAILIVSNIINRLTSK